MKSKIKIILAAAVCVCLCVSLAACSKDGKSSSSTADTTTADTLTDSSQAEESSQADTTTAEESSKPEETTAEETSSPEDSSSQQDSSQEEIKLPDTEEVYTMANDVISDAHNNHATIKDGIYKNDDGSKLSNAIDANLDERGYSDFDYEIEVSGEKVTKISINGEETLYD